METTRPQWAPVTWSGQLKVGELNAWQIKTSDGGWAILTMVEQVEYESTRILFSSDALCAQCAWPTYAIERLWFREQNLDYLSRNLFPVVQHQVIDGAATITAVRSEILRLRRAGRGYKGGKSVLITASDARDAWDWAENADEWVTVASIPEQVCRIIDEPWFLLKSKQSGRWHRSVDLYLKELLVELRQSPATSLLNRKPLPARTGR